jgi:flagellin
MLSVNNNYGAALALQNLSSTNKDLATVQNRISTGLKVGTAKDNGAVYAIAEGQRARVSAIAAVKSGIDRTSSAVDVALAAGKSIGELLQQLKEKSVAAQNADLTTSQRATLQADFAALRSNIDTIVNSAGFNGINLVRGTGNNLNVLTTDQTGTAVSTGAGIQTTAGALDITVSGSALMTDLLAGGAGTGVAANDTITFDTTANAYSVRITTNMTVNDFVNAVTTASGGSILASYNDTTGQFTYLTQAGALTVATDSSSDTAAAIGTTGTYAASVTSSTTSSYQVTGNNFSLSGALLTNVGTANIGTSVTTATTASTNIDTAITGLNDALARLGSQSKALDIQNEFLSKLSDTIEAGVGNLVDADLAKESAKLQSLQIKQQLGAQALSIANQAPSLILSFFR